MRHLIIDAAWRALDSAERLLLGFVAGSDTFEDERPLIDMAEKIHDLKEELEALK